MGRKTVRHIDERIDRKEKEKYSPATTGENRLFTFYTLADISIPKK